MKKYLNMPEITFDDILLRTIKLSDYQDMYEYGKDKDTVKYLSWGPFKSEFEAKNAIKNIFFKRPKDKLPKGYSIVDITKNKMIGTIDFHTKTKHENKVEIGFVLNKEYWNKGIVTKALAIMINLGFEYLKYDCLIIKHLEENIQSKRVIEKNNFHFIKKTYEEYYKRDYILKGNLLHYEITKEQYYANKQS